MITQTLTLAEMDSPIGTIHLFANEEGLCALYMNTHRDQLPCGVPGPNKVLDQTISELKEYFDGNRREFSVPLLSHSLNW